MSEQVEFLSAVLIVTQKPKVLAQFYRDILLPLEEERHGAFELHYGCELGDLHFAIHPCSNFPEGAVHTGSIKLAFQVFNLQNLVNKFIMLRVPLEYLPVDRGFAYMTALKDPDGNYIELTQLKDRWFNHLIERRKKGFDVIKRWETLNFDALPTHK